MCTFRLGDGIYGLPLDHVLEVLTWQPMTPVPLAPSTVAGLLNLRGQVVTAIDLRRRLALDDRAADETSMNVVVRNGDNVVSLLVDAIGDVVDVTDVDFEEPPDTLEGAARELIRGAYKLERGLLLVLNTERSVDIEFERQGFEG